MVKEKYFKVWSGYEHFVKITDQELPKALMAQMTGKVVMLSSAQIRGSAITLIEPDYHRAMGWNDRYKLGPEDHALINQDCGEYVGYLEKIKQEIRFILNGGGESKLLE